MRFTIVLALLLAAGAAQAAGISGRIQNLQGSGVFPCDINVFDRQSGAPIAVTGDSTLPNGNFAVTLPNGRYVVKFRPPIASHYFQAEDLDVRVNNNIIALNHTLATGQYLSGRVVGPDGLGVAATNIRFKDAFGNAPNNVQDDGTLADGTFLTLVDPGVWNVEIIPALAAHRAPVEFPDVDVTSDASMGDVHVAAGFVVTATVTDAGFFPILNSKLQARTAPNGSKLYTPLNTTDATGTARVVLPPGTYDFAALPPPGQPYATATARSIVLAADVTLPNFALPAGVSLSAHCVNPSFVGVANVDIDVDSLPAANPRRLETPGDATDVAGNVLVTVPAWKYRVTFNPPVSSRLVSVRLDSVQVSGPLALGNVVLPQGHWVNAITVVQGTGTPLPGANLDFIRKSNNQLAITINDVTGAAGTTQVVTDQDLYRLRVIPPNADYDTLVIDNFRSLGDTTVTLALHSRTTGAGPAVSRAGLSLAAPWPNPSRGAMTVTFAAARGRVELSAWDVTGRRLATLYRGEASVPTPCAGAARATTGRRSRPASTGCGCPRKTAARSSGAWRSSVDVMPVRTGADVIAHREHREGPAGSGPRGARHRFAAAWRRFVESAVAGRSVVSGLTLAFGTAALVHGSPVRADDLRGTVTDSLGQPVVNADFDVFDLDGNKLAPTDNTDAAGQYRLTMPAGRYDVLVQPVIGSGYAPKMIRNVDVAGTVTLDWVVPPAFRQLGRVRDSNGRPVLAARVEFDRLADGLRAPALGNTSSAFGTFAAWVEHGTFAVTATPPESTGLAPARLTHWTMPGPDTLDFTLVRASYFAGLVHEASGAPVAGVRLAFDREADSVRVPSAENRSGPDGTFRARVAPGRYRVLVEPPRGGRLTARRVSGVDLGADVSIDVTLDPGWQLGGRVTDRSGQPLVGADWDVADEATNTSVPTPGDNTDADGRFALVLPPGTFRLTLSPPPGRGLDTLVFRNVSVSRDTTFDYSYAGGGPAPAPASLRLVPLRNPTYRTATIRLALPEAGPVRVEIFDATGRRVRVLASGPFAAGTHDLAWDGQHENSAASHTGVYFVRAIAGRRSGVTRFVLLPRPPSF